MRWRRAGGVFVGLLMSNFLWALVTSGNFEAATERSFFQLFALAALAIAEKIRP